MQLIMKYIFSNVDFWYLNMLICANKQNVDYIFKMMFSKIKWSLCFNHVQLSVLFWNSHKQKFIDHFEVIIINFLIYLFVIVFQNGISSIKWHGRVFITFPPILMIFYCFICITHDIDGKTFFCLHHHVSFDSRVNWIYYEYQSFLVKTVVD
jgi:hypothetical protein